MIPPDVAESIEMELGYRFSDRSLLEQALTHSSYSAEHLDDEPYERLEFLGDAVLEVVVTHMIFVLMADADEGAMTKVRASVVDESTLAEVGRAWGLPSGLRLGIGEARSGGMDRDSIVSDAVEAILAAVFIDGGFAVAKEVIEAGWSSKLSASVAEPGVSDSRSRFQELLAQDGLRVVFTYERTGPDHAAVYTATATVDGHVVGTGVGGSKKVSAIAASSDALLRY